MLILTRRIGESPMIGDEVTVAETTLYRDDQHRLALETRGRPWSFDADAGLLRLGRRLADFLP